VALWLLLLHVTRFALFATAHLLGGSVGAGIFVLSLALRVALLPLTVSASRERMAAQREKRRPKPRGRDLFAGLLQLPLGAALYRTVATAAKERTGFLWIRDLARPDLALAIVAAAVAGLAARAGVSETQRAAVAVGMTITFLFAWRMSASVALYSIAWSGVSAVEALLAGRTARSRLSLSTRT
jgi:membrane protein insertase Oxa1/YidC/SpoIIIJ